MVTGGALHTWKIWTKFVRTLELIPEAEFFDIIGTKVLRVFLLVIHSHLYYWILLPLFLKLLVCNVNIVYGNLKSENSQGYA